MKKSPPSASLSELVGHNVRVFRASAKLSQEDLAELCGMKRTYVGAIERAEVDVRLTTLGKLAEGLKLEPYELLTDARSRLHLKR
ncbi:MAG: helix-turn-helix transcriptional regulator [Proteobacteria bacterium]|nr:helix-turn-helix transcriptional regulator [Pseudomonadota bacterium]